MLFDLPNESGLWCERCGPLDEFEYQRNEIMLLRALSLQKKSILHAVVTNNDALRRDCFKS